MYSLDCSKDIQIEVDNSGKEVVDGDKCVSVSSMLSGNGAYSILFAYAYGIFNVQDFQQISTDELAKSLKSIGDVSIKLLFSVVVFLALGMIVIALVVALFMRAITLWIYAIFSPVFALGHFFDNKIPGLDKLKTVKMTLSELIGLAMVPVVVSAGLAF
jgi:fatty acid desaturase